MAKKHEKDEPLTFIMFQNDKEKETQPDFTGKFVMPDGTIMRMAGWKKEYVGKDGKTKTLVGGKVSEFQTKEDYQKKEPVAQGNDSQDLPF